MALPFSMVGAIWFLYLAGFNLSVAVWVGIIALLGVDAETGVVMLLYLDIAYEKFKKNGLLKSMADLRESIFEGAVKRIRPKMMTVMTTMLGLASDINWFGCRFRCNEKNCSADGRRNFNKYDNGTYSLSGNILYN